MDNRQRRAPLWLVIMLAVLSILLWNEPAFSWALLPLQVFVTTLHELGHAIACMLTGGTVTGVSIVNVGQGYAGLTNTQGGIEVLIAPAGYLGATCFGCLFLWLGRKAEYAKHTLGVMGVSIVAASGLLMSQVMLQPGRFMEGLGSFGIGLAMGLVLYLLGLKLSDRWAQLLLLFLGVQTALNALSDLKYLCHLTYVTGGEGLSDATNMAAATGLPAEFWSILWMILAVVAVWFTLCVGYRREQDK